MQGMTAYSQHSLALDSVTFTWEMRSVNHRYLELNCRLPDSFRHLEMPFRDRIKKQVHRGKVEAKLSFDVNTSHALQFDLNAELLSSLQGAAHQVQSLSGDNAAGLNPADYLRWPGVLSQKTIDLVSFQADVELALEEALTQFVAARSREGAALGQILESKLSTLLVLVKQADKRVPQVLQLQRDKMQSRLAQLDQEVDQGRLEQELVFWAQKMDVAEELERLEAHAAELKHCLVSEGVQGRRLDFLMQEFNREANTLASKSMDSELTQLSVELKVLIEQMREQVQNIE